MTAKKEHGLGVLPATAICGNDITSSCLYVSALSILYAGKYAPIALLIVAAVLYLFRKIYGEVVGALPLNGGAYNALLNTTSKAWASLAACLTLLSYMATAVISASEAMHYLHSLVHSLPVVIATVVLLGIFCTLTIIGITESAVVAVGIFLFHLSSLTLLALIGAYHVFGDGTGLTTFWDNLATTPEGGMKTALFFGFAAAMLGISGFESSANFVEEQRPGVFPKTLRNMWVAVSVFNPLMAVLALALIPIPEVGPHKEQLLAHMGQVASGDWLRFLISIDAVLVLSGAVLTSYVGVTGLVRRMTLDRCLPQWLLKTNRRGSSHRIILTFFALSVSVLMLTQGDLTALAGVYTISFLSVMALFGIGNILLKVRRARLPRPEKASWPAILLAITAVLTALVGNILLEPKYLKIFLIYFLPTALLISIMLWRIGLLKLALAILNSIAQSLGRVTSSLSKSILQKIDEINSQEIVFFTNEDDLPSLNRAMLYVESNEHTNRIRFVTVVPKGEQPPKGLKEDLAFLDRAYPEIDIDFVVEEGSFGPEIIDKLSKKWNIPKNFMFIGSPGDHFPYELAQLGGVRLII
ncbi:MAG TPA: APC family permease [Planctomycetes bacterium]|nr:APC family permease [Planctomycetota bacterium]